MKWHDVVNRILECDTADLVKMADFAGISAKHLYVGADLSGTDLRGHDLSHLDLSGANLEGALLDHNTLTDPIFDPRIVDYTVRRTVTIPQGLYIFIRAFETNTYYNYTGWAIKRLFELGYHETFVSENGEEWLSWYNRSNFARKFISDPSVRRFSLKFDSIMHDQSTRYYSKLGGIYRPFRFTILVGIFNFWNIIPQKLDGREKPLDILRSIRYHKVDDIIETYEKYLEATF